MSRTRRLWRVTATYPTYTTTRHYQSSVAAGHRANLLRNGYPDAAARPLAPAVSVTIDVSDPITWPSPEATS